MRGPWHTGAVDRAPALLLLAIASCSPRSTTPAPPGDARAGHPDAMIDAHVDAGPIAISAPAPPIACPDGTAVHVGAPPDHRAWCEQPDGTRQGPFVELYPDG